MSVSVEQNGALGRRLTLTIPGESIESEVIRRLKEFGKNAKVKGFRPGKAPVNIVRREYGASVREDVVNELMRTHYSEAVQSEALAPVGAPTFDDANSGADGSFTFTVELEVYPQFEPAGMDALVLKRPQIEIGDEDVGIVMERLRLQRQNWVSVERPAAKADRVIVNFEGLAEGEPFEGNSGADIPVVLGAGEMIPGFEAGLEGISSGESRTLTLVFPEDYRANDLAGRPVSFEVTAVRVEEMEIPALDAEFAAAFGCEAGGIEQLRERVRQNMSEELAVRIEADLQRQVSEQLIAANPIEVPRALVDEEVKRAQRRVLQRLGIKTDAARMPELPREPYEEAAERQVCLGLILSRLIERETLRPDPARVEKRIEAMCAELDDPVSGAREVRADNEAMRGVEAIVLEDMIYEWLIGQAAINDEPMDFLAFMEPKEAGTEVNTENETDE